MSARAQSTSSWPAPRVSPRAKHESPPYQTRSCSYMHLRSFQGGGSLSVSVPCRRIGPRSPSLLVFLSLCVHVHLRVSVCSAVRSVLSGLSLRSATRLWPLHTLTLFSLLFPLLSSCSLFLSSDSLHPTSLSLLSRLRHAPSVTLLSLPLMLVLLLLTLSLLLSLLLVLSLSLSPSLARSLTPLLTLSSISLFLSAVFVCLSVCLSLCLSLSVCLFSLFLSPLPHIGGPVPRWQRAPRRRRDLRKRARHPETNGTPQF